MTEKDDELACELCGLVEDRAGSLYCRQCGARLVGAEEARRAREVAPAGEADVGATFVDEPSSPAAPSSEKHEAAPSTKPEGPPAMERPFGTTTRGLGSPRAVTRREDPPAIARTADDVFELVVGDEARVPEAASRQEPPADPPSKRRFGATQPTPKGPAREAPERASAAVERVLASRMGPAPSVAALLTAVRGIAALALALGGAAVVVHARDAWGRALFGASSSEPTPPALDAIVALGFVVAGVAAASLVFGLTDRGWRRPKWDRSS